MTIDTSVGDFIGEASSEALKAEIERLKDVIDQDRYKSAIALQNISRAVGGRRWLAEGGRGSYAYDDERYQEEFGHALDEIDASLKVLRHISRDWSDSPRDPLRVTANRNAAMEAVVRIMDRRP